MAHCAIAPSDSQLRLTLQLYFFYSFLMSNKNLLLLSHLKDRFYFFLLPSFCLSLLDPRTINKSSKTLLYWFVSTISLDKSRNNDRSIHLCVCVCLLVVILYYTEGGRRDQTKWETYSYFFQVDVTFYCSKGKMRRIDNCCPRERTSIKNECLSSSSSSTTTGNIKKKGSNNHLSYPLY